MRYLLSILTHSAFWKILCEILLKVGEFIAYILSDKESEYDDMTPDASDDDVKIYE